MTKEDNDWQEIDYKSYDKIIDSMRGGAEYYLDDIIVVGTRIDNGESLLEKLEATRVKGIWIYLPLKIESQKICLIKWKLVNH